MKRTIVFIPTVILILLLGFITTGDARQKSKESCVTAKCHVSFGKAKFVHGPVAVAECSACHKLLPDEKHKFQPIKNAGELCFTCHEKMPMKATVHSPVAKGDCTGCHDPHQSNQQYQLKKSSLSDLCFSCHKKDLIKKKYAHSPATAGECNSCHTPHSSDKPKLLSKSVNEVCFQCHSDMQENFASAKHLHKPAMENCVNCHNPHSNNAKFMLAKNVPDQCFACHSNIENQITKSLVKHKALDGERQCLACHLPHDAPHIKQLKDEPMTLCLSCHDNQLKKIGSKLTDMKELFDKNIDWHGPVRERDCSGCHQVHGSDNFRILAQKYPAEFYTSFSADKYGLCFNCHQPTLVQDQNTTTLTNFRDGNRNLHYLHVNKKVKGRTCRSCHETHASNNARHIRDTVPFGQWSLPIKFEKEINGGKCSPGCHAPKEYNRKIVESMKPETEE